MSPLLFHLGEMSAEIEQIVSAHLSPDQFLVEVLVKGTEANVKVVVLVDSDLGMTIDACAELSRKVSYDLEAKNTVGERYTLEVSSPGADRPIQSKRQFRKNIGRKFEVIRKNGKSFEGYLAGVDESFLLFEKTSLHDGQVGTMINGQYEIALAEIETAKVEISFK